jgi:hypothetical protein
MATINNWPIAGNGNLTPKEIVPKEIDDGLTLSYPMISDEELMAQTGQKLEALGINPEFLNDSGVSFLDLDIPAIIAEELADYQALELQFANEMELVRLYDTYLDDHDDKSWAETKKIMIEKYLKIMIEKYLSIPTEPEVDHLEEMVTYIETPIMIVSENDQVKK